MSAVNAFFSAFADKTMAFEFNHLVSLYCFSSKIEKKCDFIDNYTEFIKLVDSANPGGGTKLFDTLNLACDSLINL